MMREASVMPNIDVMCISEPLVEALRYESAPDVSVSEAESGWLGTNSSE